MYGAPILSNAGLTYPAINPPYHPNMIDNTCQVGAKRGSTPEKRSSPDISGPRAPEVRPRDSTTSFHTDAPPSKRLGQPHFHATTVLLNYSQHEQDGGAPEIGWPMINENSQETNPLYARQAKVPGYAGDRKRYHKGTRMLRDGGPAAPYSDLPEDEYYAPGFTIAQYQGLCSLVCGKVVASKVEEGKRPKQVRRGYVFVEDDNTMRCVICATPFNTPRHVELHFPKCVTDNGNPLGYHVRSPSQPDCSNQLKSSSSGSTLQTFSLIGVSRGRGLS